MLGEGKSGADTVVVLLLLLSATTGLVDAVSVLSLGRVFTANMTGNVVFLGFALAGVPGFRWPLYVTGLLAFSLGAFAAGALAQGKARPRRPWLLKVAVIEAALLGAAALVATVSPVIPKVGETAPMLAMIALTAMAMGVRNATVRAMKAPDLTTTVLTLTITGLAADLRTVARPVLLKRFLAVVAILAGALCGALLLRFGPALPLVMAAAIILGATILLAHEEDPAPAPHA